MHEAGILLQQHAALGGREVPARAMLCATTLACPWLCARCALPLHGVQAYIFTKPKISPAKLESYADALSRCKPAVALAAAALLMQAGYFFTALKAVYK